MHALWGSHSWWLLFLFFMSVLKIRMKYLYYNVINAPTSFV